MSQPPIPSPPPLTVSVVLHLSDLDRFAATLRGLGRAVATLPVPQPVPVLVVDQSLDPVYSERLGLLVEDLLAGECSPALTIDLLIHSENRGYGHGHNLARARLATTSTYHLVLNPDVELAEGALAAAVAALESDRRAVLAAPVSSTHGGRREYLAKDYPSLRALLLRGFAPRWLQQLGAPELARYELHHLDTAAEPVEIPIASGACMLIRRQALDVVGGFDERYFLYFEDFDLSLRLARWGRLLQVPDMRIVHHGGAAARKGIQHIRWFAAGAWRFFRQWGWRLW